MDFKNDYTVHDAVMMATQFYLEETGSGLSIYAVDKDVFQIIGPIRTTMGIIIEELNLQPTALLDESFVTLTDKEKIELLQNKKVSIEVNYKQSGARHINFYVDFENVSYNMENLTSAIEQFTQEILNNVLAKATEYEKLLNTFKVIDTDAAFATLIASKIKDDFKYDEDFIANEIFGMLYGAFCRNCRYRHNPYNECDNLE